MLFSFTIISTLLLLFQFPTNTDNIIKFNFQEIHQNTTPSDLPSREYLRNGSKFKIANYISKSMPHKHFWNCCIYNKVLSLILDSFVVTGSMVVGISRPNLLRNEFSFPVNFLSNNMN